MKIVIVGGGASGLLCALAIKKKHHNYEVEVVDRNNKLGKKLRATGNGKCNIANFNIKPYAYSNSLIANKLFKEIPINYLLNFFHESNIETIDYDGYIYPYSESANMLADTLIEHSIKLGVKFDINTIALDYKNHYLKTNKGDIYFDKLVIASGLSSQVKLGADSNFVLNLKNHNYHIEKILPSLIAIKTKENVKLVNGIRRKVNVTLCSNKKIYFQENGEMIFKKDGISGIVIFNASAIIRRLNLKNLEIIVDFLPNQNFNKPLSAYFTKPLVNFLKQFGNPKKVIFHIKDYYDFDDSIACIGGVSLNDVDDNFKSKIEDNVYIIGEALNQDGICGGYNLMWAFSTALKVSDII